MKKFAKLSIVAAVAVAGLTTANAQDLSEAIKNVDVSGTVTYRYNDYETNAGNGQTTENNYKVALNVNSKVNDDVTANTRFLVESFSMNTGTSADANVDFKLSEVNFSYTGLTNTAVTLGKQGINTAFSVSRDSIGTEATGTGIVAAYNAGPVNLFAGYFNQTNFNTNNDAPTRVTATTTITGAEDTSVVGLSASLGGVNVDASYLNVDDIADAYTVGLNASYKLGEIDLSSYARYSSLELETADSQGNKDNSLWKVGVSANMGIFGAYAAYGETDKDGGYVGFDASSTTGFDEHWRVTLSGIADASVLYVGASAQVTDQINVALKYSDLEDDAPAVDGDDTQNEIYTQVVYQMSSNFVGYARLGVLDREAYTEDVTIGRLHVQYSF